MWLDVALRGAYLRLPWLYVAWRRLVSVDVGSPPGSQRSLAPLTFEYTGARSWRPKGGRAIADGLLLRRAAASARLTVGPVPRIWAVPDPALGQTGKSFILTPMASAMRARSPGSLVTTGAWFWTAVTMTMASTTSAVPDAAQATPAARPTRWSSEDVAALQDPRYLVLRPAAPGLRQHDNRHDRVDPRPGHLIMQRQEIRIAALGRQQGTGVIDDRAHYPAASRVSSSSSPVSSRNWRARWREAVGSAPVLMLVLSDQLPRCSAARRMQRSGTGLLRGGLS